MTVTDDESTALAELAALELPNDDLLLALELSCGPDPEGERPYRYLNGRRVAALTDEIRVRVVQALRAGATTVDACTWAGISVEQHGAWLRRAVEYDMRRPGDARLEDLDPIEEAFRAYAIEVVEAASNGRVTALLQIRDIIARGGDPTQLRAAIWWVERRIGGAWAKHTSIELSGKGGGPIEVEVTRREEDLAARLHAQLQAAVASGEIVDAEIVDEDEFDPYEPWAGVMYLDAGGADG